MNNIILLIGAGNLGSRYLQGLKVVNSKLTIYVFDIFEDSLLKAKNFYDLIPENNFNKEIYFNTVNLGDCRLVIVYKNGNVKQITTDHKPDNFIEKNRIDLIRIYSQHYKSDGDGILAINFTEFESTNNVDVSYIPMHILALDIIDNIKLRKELNNENIIYFFLQTPVEEKIIEIDIRSLNT